MRNSVLFVATLLSLMLMNFAAFAHDGILFPSNTDVLPTAASLKELIPANNERQQSDDFSVMADDEPMLTTHDTLWGASTQCLCDSIRVIHDIVELKTLFGISDAGSDEGVTLVSSSKTLKNGEHCADTVIIAYVVADATGSQTTIYHAQFIQDTIRPTFTVAPKDTALCVDPDGNYENTVTRVADEITITNLHDNCTKLQESFSVQSSMDTSRFDFYHPRGYRITQGDSDNGVRHYKQLWTVTDSCGNTTYDSISIHVRPLPKITQITILNQNIIYGNDQNIIYGDAIRDVWIYHQYSDLSITGLSGIGLDSLGCSVEHKKDQNNNEYDRVYGDPEFAVSNATFLVTATSHQGWGCSIDESTFSITVDPRPIVITATDVTKKYDGTPLTSNNYTCTTDEGSLDDALVHDDVISSLSFSGSQTIVGSCTNYIENARITAPNDTTIDKTSNYSIDYYTGTLTVTENDTLIKVIPGSASKVYDGSPLTKNNHDDFTVTGVPEGLTWTATADGTVTNVVPGEGEKAVNAVTSFHIFDANNNDVTAYFTNINTDSTGTLTITPVSVIVNAVAESKIYGEADPTLTATFTGVLEGDSFIPSYTISRETGDTVGQYIITPAGDVAQGNYAVTYDTALLTITPKALTITVNNAEKAYGQADPTFTGTVEGLVNPTDLGTISYIRTNTEVEAVGTYEDVLSATYTPSDNYNVTVNKGDFTIHCRNIVEPANWPANLTNQNNCFANADTIGLKDASEIQTLFANCNSVTNAGEVTVTTQDNATATSDCGWTWTRTYNISITYGCASTTKTMSVSGRDQNSPHLKADSILPSNENQNACFSQRAAAPSTDVIKALFEDDCSNVSVSYEGEIINDEHDCGWRTTYNYVVSDGCPANDITIQLPQSGGDLTSPVLTGSWPDNITGQNNCLANADKSGLKDASYIQALYEDFSGIVTVTFKDDTIGNDCAWTITRTYTVKDGCQNALDTDPTMSVSGGDRNKPSFTVPVAKTVCPNADGSYNIAPTVTGNVSNLSDDCHSAAQLAIDYSDSDPELLPSGKRQIIRTWTVTDACGNDSVQTQTITINPLVELTLTNATQNIFVGDPMEPVQVSCNYANLTYSTLPDGLNYNSTTNVLSGTLMAVGEYSVTFTANSNQTPNCGTKQETVNITVERIEEPVVIISDSAAKFYDGTPLTGHHYVVTFGGDTVTDVDATGRVFTLFTGDHITVTPDPASTLTNAGVVDNLFGYTLENEHRYLSVSRQYGKLIVNRATLTMELDTARTYDGHPFVVTANQLHVTGLAPTDHFTGGTITTDSYVAKNYLCRAGNFHAMMEDGVAVQSGFAIDNGLDNYVPDFNVTLHILPVTEGFDCPDELEIVLKDDASDTMVTLPASASLTPMMDHIVISNNLSEYNPMTPGSYTITWTLSDDLGNAMTSCEQIVTVEYFPCLGVSYQGYDYDAVRVGSQCWLAENLRWATGNHKAYNEDASNVEKFGYLYSWYTAVGVTEGNDEAVLTTYTADDGTQYVQGICPTGWSVGSLEDYELLNLTAGSTNALKDTSTQYWQSGFEGTMPNTGFAARAGGWYNSSLNRYEDIMTSFHFWKADDPGTSTVVSTTTVIPCKISYWCDRILYDESLKTDLRSVRCIRKVAQ